MGAFKSAVITLKGQALLTKVMAGEVKLAFTKIAISETKLTGDIASKTDIGKIKQSVKVEYVKKINEANVKASVSFSNVDLKEGYYVRTIGLYAKDPQEGEICYSISCADESTATADWMPPFNSVGISTLVVDLVTAVSNSEKVEITVDPTGMATIAQVMDLADALKKVETFVGYQEGATSTLSVNSEGGAMGIRYWDGVLSVKDGSGEWVEVDSGGGSGIAPNNVTGLSVKSGNGKLTVFWKDPNDTVVEGQTLSTWAGTKLVYKAGSYPANSKDGILVVDNKVRGAYATNGFELSGLTNGVTYYFQLFPYSDKKAENQGVANRVTGTPQEYVVYGVQIDLTNSDPNSWATYTDDAVGMVAGSDAWDSKPIFNNIQSVLLKNGAEVGKLKKGNPTQFENGKAADITSGAAGDVMTKFGTYSGYKISTVGNILTVQITDDPNRAGFCYKAFQRGKVDKDAFYLGRYKGWVDGGKLRSLSGKTPTANQTIGTFRTQAQANGAGYDQSGYYQLVYRQCLYIIKYLAKNAQSVIGKGNTSGGSLMNTGGTNGRGKDTYGDPNSSTTQVILFGLEDFYGNIWEWIDGIYSDASRNIHTTTQKFNDTGAGYETTTPSGLTANTGGYMSKPQGNNDGGFCTKETSGSSTTYFCDSADLYAGRVACFGGNWGNNDYAGVFYLVVHTAAGSVSATFGGRLMFL